MDGGNAYSQVYLKNLRRYTGLPSKESGVLEKHQFLIPISFRVQIVYLKNFLMDMGMVPTVQLVVTAVTAELLHRSRNLVAIGQENT